MDNNENSDGFAIALLIAFSIFTLELFVAGLFEYGFELFPMILKEIISFVKTLLNIANEIAKSITDTGNNSPFN